MQLSQKPKSILSKIRNIPTEVKTVLLATPLAIATACSKGPTGDTMQQMTQSIILTDLDNNVNFGDLPTQINLAANASSTIDLSQITDTAENEEPITITTEVLGDADAITVTRNGDILTIESTGIGGNAELKLIAETKATSTQVDINKDGIMDTKQYNKVVAERLVNVNLEAEPMTVNQERLEEINSADYYAGETYVIPLEGLVTGGPYKNLFVVNEDFPTDLFPGSSIRTIKDSNGNITGIEFTATGSYNKSVFAAYELATANNQLVPLAFHFRKGIQEDLSNSAAIEAVQARAQHHFLQSAYNAFMEDPYFDTVDQAGFTPLEEAPEIKLSLNGLDGEVKEGAIRFIDQINTAMSITRPNQKFVIVENDASASFRAGFGDANGNLGTAIVERENDIIVGSNIIVAEGSRKELNKIATFGQELFNALTNLGFDQSSERTSTNHLSLAQTDSYSFIDIYNTAVAFAFPKGVKVDQAPAVYDRITSEKKYGPNKNQTILQVLIDMENARIDSIEAEFAN